MRGEGAEKKQKANEKSMVSNLFLLAKVRGLLISTGREGDRSKYVSWRRKIFKAGVMMNLSPDFKRSSTYALMQPPLDQSHQPMKRPGDPAIKVDSSALDQSHLQFFPEEGDQRVSSLLLAKLPAIYHRTRASTDQFSSCGS